MHNFNGKTYPCCTSLTMGIIGGKWKSVILYYLIEKPLRYNELRKIMVEVTERTLSLQLKNLEDDGVIERKVYGVKPPIKVEYSLTDFGKTLIPFLHLIAEWGDSVVENHFNPFWDTLIYYFELIGILLILDKHRFRSLLGEHFNIKKMYLNKRFC